MGGGPDLLLCWLCVGWSLMDVSIKRKDAETVSDFNMLWETDEAESALSANKYLTFCLIKY